MLHCFVQRTGEDPQQWAVTANITGGHYNAAPLQGIEGETTERIPIPRSSMQAVLNLKP